MQHGVQKNEKLTSRELNVKIIIDMNLSPLWVERFLMLGFSALHWSSVGDPRAADETILNWASENDYIVFTHDLDFGSLLIRRGKRAPSVIQVRTQEVDPNEIGDIVINAIKEFDQELRLGALITVDLEKSRARILSIK
jgi:predicted nuclease of predicted toxin-antitoxin system